MIYEDQEDFLELDKEIDAINFFSKLQNKLPRKIKQLKDYALKLNDQYLSKLIENIENIINGYVDKKDIY